MDKLNEKIKEVLDKDKKTSNLILIVVLLVIVLISTNYIFKDEKETTTKETVSSNIVEDTSSIEKRLANIISEIQGVDKASVLITYSSTEKIIPIYDTKENIDTTSEDDKTSTKKTIEKNVAYEDNGDSKNVVVESKETAEATGAIIVVKGSITEATKSKIKEAVSYATTVPLHKIQIFVN